MLMLFILESFPISLLNGSKNDATKATILFSSLFFILFHESFRFLFQSSI